MAHKVIVQQKKNYVPQFLKQRDINSYFSPLSFVAVFGSGMGKNQDPGTSRIRNTDISYFCR